MNMEVIEQQKSVLRSEAEIIAEWEKGPEEPTVSISCCAFNHEAYIETALIGFLIQETSFPFEVLIHDDASKDGTADIIHAYHERYPRIIKPIFQVENQYSKGNKPGRINHKRALGEFIAVCEGDDCWTDASKLQRQVDALMDHPDIDLCFHSATKIDYSKGQLTTLIGRYAETSQAVIPIESIVLRPHGLIPTASVLVRSQLFDEIREFRESRKYLAVGDIYLFFFGARRGGALYLDRNMSLYRAKLPGSWTLNNHSDYKKRISSIRARLRSYDELDEYTNHQFSSVLKLDNNRRILGILKEANIPMKEKFTFFRQNVNRLNLSNKIRALAFIFVAPLWHKVLSKPS